jgi:hypothetical protein
MEGEVLHFKAKQRLQYDTRLLYAENNIKGRWATDGASL